MTTPPDPLDQDALITDAWRILGELMATGEATLSSGKTILADDPVVGVVEKVARLRKPTDTRMAVVEGFRVAPTKTVVTKAG